LNLALPPPLSWPPTGILPWHVAIVLAALALVGFALARIQFQNAREDWANAFFYSPSQKTKQRQRRQRWQDRMWAALAIAFLCLIAAGVLYLRGPRQPAPSPPPATAVPDAP
jgi:peptidoglycan/LPS O-acetylase OafA/YrhL